MTSTKHWRHTAGEGLADNVTYETGDAHHLPHADAEFDIVTLQTVVSHLDDPLQVLREAGRVVRPDGTVAVFDGDGRMEFASGGLDSITIFAVLGGVKRSIISTGFRGGEVTAFMGGFQLDLRQAVIAPGEEAVLELLVGMGGGEIIVPPSWTVATPVVPIMGGVDDKRLPPVPGSVENFGGKAAPRLVLKGLLMMGGLEIKS